MSAFFKRWLELIAICGAVLVVLAIVVYLLAMLGSFGIGWFALGLFLLLTALAATEKGAP